MSNPIPKHEPEVVAAGTKKHRGDSEKVSTTGIRVLEVEGVSLLSRYNKAEELALMRDVLISVEPGLRRFVESMYCDSKGCACYDVVLHECTSDNVLRIADQFGAEFIRLSGGYNALSLRLPSGAVHGLGPYWLGDVE